MKPVRTPYATMTYRVPNGDPKSDLPVEPRLDETRGVTLTSTWELTDAERRSIAAGADVELIVWGHAHPPVALAVSTVRLDADAASDVWKKNDPTVAE